MSEHDERILTIEEELLAALLSANQELTDALRVYEDLERVKIERDTERRSKKETRMDPRVSEQSIIDVNLLLMVCNLSSKNHQSNILAALALLDVLSLLMSQTDLLRRLHHRLLPHHLPPSL